MSRLGKKIISIPKDTKISYSNKELVVTGPKGSLSTSVNKIVDLEVNEGSLRVFITSEDKKEAREAKAFLGLTRSIVNNMVIGVSKGFEKSLEINGIGYRAELKGSIINLNLGFSHIVNFQLPEGVTAQIDKNVIKLSSIDKELLGGVAASIRKIRSPEPYKGKGIKYKEERIQKKAGKTGKKK